MFLRPISLGILMMTWSALAFAADGVLEINQSCAIHTGCFTDDQPGFPVTITSRGSYILTSNLFVDGFSGSNPDTAIDITANVSLDMAGFGIRAESAAAVQATLASSVSNGFVVSESGNGGGSLILLPDRSTVRNLFGRYSVEIDGTNIVACGDECTLSDLRLEVTEATSAITCGDDCVISEVAIRDFGAGAWAITCGNGCILSDIAAGGSSIVAGARTNLRNSDVGSSTIGGSSQSSVFGNESVIDGCTISVDQFGDTPVVCGEGCIVSGTAFTRAGFDTGQSALLSVGTGSLVRGNIFRNSTGVGLQTTGDVGYSGNVFTNNNGGNANPQVTGGTDLGENLCGTRTTCP